MGWCGGTEIFDTVIDSMIDNKIESPELIKDLINVLEDHDWDNLCESDYYDYGPVNKIIKEIHPNWFEDES